MSDLQNLCEQKASVVELLQSQCGGEGHTGSSWGSFASEPSLIDELVRDPVTKKVSGTEK